MKINLHLGAHKTATTFIQSQLARNLSYLNDRGVGYMPLSEFRRSFTQPLMSLSKEKFSAQELTRLFFPHRQPNNPIGLLMSDENLVGSPMEFVKSGAPFLSAPGRLSHLRNLLSDYEVHLCFSIRSYADFFSSNYCESLRHTKDFVRFVDFRTKINLENSRWPVIVQKIVDALQPASTFIWRFEDFSGSSEAIIKRVALGVAPPLLDEGSRRLSFSQTAVDVLNMVVDRHGPAVAGKAVQAISNALPKGDDLLAFDPWSDAQRRALDELYMKDCNALRLPSISQSM